MATGESFHIVINPLPENGSQYQSWRFHVQTRLLNILPLDNAASRDYHNQLEYLTFDQVRGSPSNTVLQRVDNRLFTAVHGSCRAPSQEPYALRIQVECEFGNGRQALEALDMVFGYEASRLAELGADTLANTICKSMEELQAYCSKIRLALMRVRGMRGAVVPDIMVVPQIKRAVENINDTNLAVALSTYSARPASQRSVGLLLDVLEFQASEYKTRQERLKTRPKALLGVTTGRTNDGRPFTGRRRWCQIVGHNEVGCKQKAAGKPKAKPPKSGNGGGNGGGGGGNGNDKNGTKDKNKRKPCIHCGKKNHPSESRIGS